jgi:hypothetical protein
MSLERFSILVDFEEDDFVGFLCHARTKIDEHARFILFDRRAQLFKGLYCLGLFLHVELEPGDLRYRSAGFRVGSDREAIETERREAGACCTKSSAGKAATMYVHGMTFLEAVPDEGGDGKADVARRLSL